ncbi:HIT domain-containing protein [Patescibacteria group bacterium]|nr:HIT domain-containing protein [Patescibacteria group bacterium]
MKKNCIFCGFQKTEVFVNKIYEDENFFAIHDLNPKAPVHVICIAKKHISKIKIQKGTSNDFYSAFIQFAHKVAKSLGLDKKGYQLKMNYSGYNEIDHEHIHLMAGFSDKDL